MSSSKAEPIVLKSRVKSSIHLLTYHVCDPVYITYSMFTAMFQDPKKLRKSEPLRGPTGMNREVYALLYSDTNTR